MTEETPQSKRKRPKMTLLQIFSSVILIGVILIVGHTQHWL
ncbi:MAG: hypothetical protein NTV32_06830 [Gammaproteobacteria bacterium]|nr:hypothetical protein [Gammaproteobacteria bacterium]